MLTKKEITKEYKYIVIDYSNCERVGWSDWETEKLEYRFVNKAPRYSMESNLNRGCKFLVREYFQSDSTGSKRQAQPFLKDDQPANEAYLTKALVEKLKHEILKDSKDLKDRKDQLQDYVWKGKGFVDMTKTYEQAIERVERRLIGQRKQLRVWKKKYGELIDAGVYTYLELLK
jgi:hypothetical protein